MMVQRSRWLQLGQVTLKSLGSASSRVRSGLAPLLVANAS